MKLYGMFIHFGPNTFKEVAWGDGKFGIEDFCVENIEVSVENWVRVALEAKMDYLVLTAKHHDGFCLWDTKYSDYKITNSPTNIDLVEVLAKECKKQGIKLGLYYSLWDLNYPQYSDDETYAKYMQNQITELLTSYGDVTELWFDGAWDKDYPGGSDKFDPSWITNKVDEFNFGTRWQWEELYNLIHKLQPNCEVINNSGFDRPGKIKYMPIDCRTSERTSFVQNQQLITASVDTELDQEGIERNLPLEYVLTLNPDWFYTGADRYFQQSVESVYGTYRLAKKHNNRVLLNVGPTKDGLIIDSEIAALSQIAKLIEEE